jgi:predicted nucleotidyltransferase
MAKSPARRNHATEKWNRTVHKEIQHLVDQIVERFTPLRVILFGSHAQGSADADSDVDLLVAMPDSAKPITSLDVRRAISYSIPLDVLVYTLHDLEERITAGDFFLQDAVETGEVLYTTNVQSLGIS